MDDATTTEGGDETLSRVLGLNAGWTAGVGLVCSVGAGAMAMVVMSAVTGGSASSAPVLVAVFAVLWAGLFVTCRVAVARYGSGKLADLGLGRLVGRDLWVGMVFGIGLRFLAAAVAGRLIPLFPANDFAASNVVTGGLDGSRTSVLIIVAVTVIGAPFFEELFFRGLVMASLVPYMSLGWVIVIQAVLFAVAHLTIGMSLGQATVTFGMIMTVGVGLGWLRCRYGTLGPGMVAHAVFNLSALIILLVAAR